MHLRQRSRQAIVAIFFLAFVMLACSPLKEPTSAPTFAPSPVASTPTTFTTAEPSPILVPPIDTSVPGPASAATRAAGGGLLSLYGQQPVTLDPALAGDVNSHEYIGKVFSGLVRMSADLEVLPDIAERWEVDDSHTVYTFYLRKNVKFHSGRPVTAEDVKYSIERSCAPGTGSRVASSYLGDIVGALDKLSGRASTVSGVQVLDNYVVRIMIDAPKAYFLAKLAYPTSAVVDREQVEGALADWWTEANGTGPFRLEQFDSEFVILRANDGFYRGRPSLDEVVYRLTGGGAVGQYERDQIDVAPVGASDIDRALDPNNSLHDELLVVHSLDTFYLTFNTTMAPFDDPKVRLAFAYATNKRAMADVILNKMVEPAVGILPPDMPGYNKDLRGIPFDPDMALDLLDESGYAGDVPIVYTVSGQGGPSAMHDALAESYRQNLGVEIEIQQVSWPRFLDGLDERQFQMFFLGWIADYPDPENFLDLLFHSQSEYNHIAYSNPEVDALLEQARIEADRQTRLNLYRKVEELLVWDGAWIPLYHDIDYQLVKPYVKGLAVSPQGFYFLENVVVEPH